MPLIKSKSPAAFKSNVKTELSAGKPRAQALAIAYDVKRRARADGGSVHVGPIASDVPGRTDLHPMDVGSGSYVIPAEAVSNLGENNTAAGLKKLEQVCASTPEEIRKFFGAGGKFSIQKFARGGAAHESQGIGRPVPINAAGGEYVMAPKIVAIVGNGDVSRGHEVLDAWVMKRRKHHINTLKKLPPPARD